MRLAGSAAVVDGLCGAGGFGWSAGIGATPARPLLPMQKISAGIVSRRPECRSARGCDGYRVYADRADSLAPLRKYLPSDAVNVGFVCSDDDSEVSLWLPLGSRKVFDLVPEDTAGDLQTADVRIHCCRGGGAGAADRISMSSWLGTAAGSSGRRRLS